MLIDFLLLNFEVLVFLTIIFIVLGIFLLYIYQSQKFENNKKTIVEYANYINNSDNEIKNYLVKIINIIEQQKNEITKTTEKINFIEREINRLSNLKGSEDMLGFAIQLARNGENRENIKKETGLRDDEVEAIYTYYRK